MYLVIVDSKEGWGVTIGSFINVALLIGYIKTYSLIIIEYQDLLNAPTSLLILSSTVLSFSFAILSPVSNFLTNRFTTRKCMYLASCTTLLSMISMTYAYNIVILLLSTVILAISFSVFYAPSLAINMKCHKKRQNLSQSIVGAGAPFGSLFIPLILSELIPIYSTRGFMLIMSGIFLHFAVSAGLMPTHIVEIKDNYKPILVSMENYKKKSIKEFITIGDLEICSTAFIKNSETKWPPRKLWCSLFLCCIAMGSIMSVYIILIGLYGLCARDLSIDIKISAYLLVSQSGIDFLTKIICGLLIDTKLISRWAFFVSFSFVLSLISVFFGTFPTITSFYIYVFGFGVFSAPLGSLFTLLLLDLVGTEFLNASLSIYLITQGVIGLIFGYLIGYICDITGSTFYGIIVLGLIIGFGVSILVIEYFSRKRL